MTVATVDKAALLAPRLAEEDIEVPGVGVVRVRSLTREEGLRLRNTELSSGEMDRVLLAAALVDPALTEDEVAQWQRVSPPTEIEEVSAAILRLSGMLKSAPKEAMQTFRDRSGD